MKRTNRHAALWLVLAAWLVVLALCAGCGLVTAALRDVGFPVGSEVVDAARAVDAAGTNWLLWLLLGGGGLGAAKGAQVAVRRRRARKAAQSPAP